MLAEAPAALPVQRRLSVGQWLVLLVVVLFVGPLLISNLWGYLQSQQYLTDSAFRNLRDLAALEAIETDELVRAATDSVQALTRDDDLVGALRAAGAPGSPAGDAGERLHAQLRAGAARLADAAIDELQLVSRDGGLLASSRAPDTAAPDLTSALCFQRGRTASAVIGFEPQTRDPPNLVVATPVVVDGAPVGVLCARFRFAAYQRLLAHLTRRSGGGRVQLLDDQRRVIVSSPGLPDRVGDRPSWLPRSAEATAWTMRGRSPDGEALIVAYAPVAGPGWGIVVAQPLAATTADLETLKWQALAVFASLMAVVALAVFLAWRTLVRPLRALATTSERIAGGASGATVSTTGPREIANLASEFNRMSVAIRDAHQTLEERIAARTRALRDSEQFLELLVNSIDQRVVVTDRDHRIIKSNAAVERAHGRSLVGELCYRAFEARDAPCDGCPVARTFTTGVPAVAERSQTTAGGQEPVAIETYPVRDDAGRVQSVISISRVITREKQLQAQLAFQEKLAAFGQLAAGVAHELGNPLASIDSQLQRAEADPARAAASVAVVRKEVGRMARMLRELVDFSRRKRDAVHLASPNQIVVDVARLLEHDPRARDAELVRDLAPEVPGVRIVEDHLVQVLVNLGLNALDALDQDRRVVLSTRAADGAVELRVADTGTGVPPDAQARLFEPFYTTKAHGRGTGLGLFVSKRIVEDMGGTLRLESTGPTGTVFVVRLPPPRTPREPA
jgi:C4-dicarboxylate-specific signal transduction histidine kinase